MEYITPIKTLLLKNNIFGKLVYMNHNVIAGYFNIYSKIPY
jgi:hypothetical protein